MSVYAYIAGEIQYPDLERYEAAKTILRDGCWIDEEGSWLDEMGSEIEGSDNSFQENVLSITIPLFCHRNLLHVLDRLINGACLVSGKWASTDGMFSGGEITDGEPHEIDLHTWAAENELGGDEGYSEPPDMDDDWEDYAEWQTRVLDAFLED
jgi:hypothetical protein